MNGSYAFCEVFGHAKILAEFETASQNALRIWLGRQVHARWSSLTLPHPQTVQTTSPLLAVRRLGCSSGQVGRRGSLPGTMSGCPMVSVLEADHCICLLAFLPFDNVELDFVTFFERFVPVRLNR